MWTEAQTLYIENIEQLSELSTSLPSNDLKNFFLIVMLWQFWQQKVRIKRSKVKADMTIIRIAGEAHSDVGTFLLNCIKWLHNNGKWS